VEKYTTTLTRLGVHSKGIVARGKCGSAQRSTCTVAYVETRFTESIKKKINGESFEARAHPEFFTARVVGGDTTVRFIYTKKIRFDFKNCYRNNVINVTVPTYSV
jgi:hypothetical protein